MTGEKDKKSKKLHAGEVERVRRMARRMENRAQVTRGGLTKEQKEKTTVEPLS